MSDYQIGPYKPSRESLRLAKTLRRMAEECEKKALSLRQRAARMEAKQAALAAVAVRVRG